MPPLRAESKRKCVANELYFVSILMKHKLCKLTIQIYNVLMILESYDFIAPAVNPSMIFFCRQIYNRIIGTIENKKDANAKL